MHYTIGEDPTSVSRRFLRPNAMKNHCIDLQPKEPRQGRETRDRTSQRR
jgi:hypothetical protein